MAAGNAARSIRRWTCCGRRDACTTTRCVPVGVGAHIGTHTIYALRSGRFTRAIALEPEPRNARLLAMNLEVNGLSQAAIVVRKAAGASNHRGRRPPASASSQYGCSCHRQPPFARWTGFARSADGAPEEELESLGIAPSDIGLIWIDAEGYEPQVLDGLAENSVAFSTACVEFTPSRYSSKTAARCPACSPSPAFKASDAATPAGR